MPPDPETSAAHLATITRRFHALNQLKGAREPRRAHTAAYRALVDEIRTAATAFVAAVARETLGARRAREHRRGPAP